jgi:hypothetical protein
MAREKQELGVHNPPIPHFLKSGTFRLSNTYGYSHTPIQISCSFKYPQDKQMCGVNFTKLKLTSRD